MFARRGATRSKTTGKCPVSFTGRNAQYGLGMTLRLPCGQCVGCRLEYSRQWAMRCMCEASMFDENCMITLTYDEEHLPPYGSLQKEDFQKFMKRLRKALYPEFVRYYYAGEYGDRTGRPHYHALLFGYDFGDKYPWSKRGDFQAWRSDLLESLWTVGQSEIGSVTFESASYVARYVMKKVMAGVDYQDMYMYVSEDGEIKYLEKEFTDMSRNPGIGTYWFAKHHKEVYRHDSVVMRGEEMLPPRFFDNVYELLEPDHLEAVRSRRRRRMYLKKEDNTLERLDVKEECARARVGLFPRKEV